MLASYFPVLVFIFVGLAAGVLFILLGTILGPKRHYAEKDAAYECGFEAFENARMKFDVRYYLVAILFILFDLEVAFMLPWAVVFKDLGAYGFWSMLVFIVVLTVGFIYEWKKVRWNGNRRRFEKRFHHHQRGYGVELYAYRFIVAGYFRLGLLRRGNDACGYGAL